MSGLLALLNLVKEAQQPAGVVKEVARRNDGMAAGVRNLRQSRDLPTTAARPQEFLRAKTGMPQTRTAQNAQFFDGGKRHHSNNSSGTYMPVPGGNHPMMPDNSPFPVGQSRYYDFYQKQAETPWWNQPTVYPAGYHDWEKEYEQSRPWYQG